jgi:hypothetical protein
MATMPYPANTDIAVQNNMTGEVDYLNFNGSQLVASDAVTYAGAGWNVVAQGSFGGPAGHDLVLQNNLSNVVGFLGVGFLDFLKLDANGKLVTSAMSNFAIFPVVGQGFFNSAYPGQLGPTLVSQLPDGELDMLGYDASGTLIHSDLVSNSIGLPPVVGVGEADTGEGPTHYSLFAGTGTGANDSIVTQLPDGSIDDIGISGDFAASTLSVTNSLLLPGSAGMAPVQAVNQEVGGTFGNESLLGGKVGTTNVEGVQFVQELSNGTLNNVYADSGYADAAHEGTIYASNQLNLGMPGWHVVDGGAIARELYPIT